jgi:(E)-4-hydroxy-3-methylbut-2-enyl-diphosphate synthase
MGGGGKGPGEAGEADVGVAGGREHSLIFSRGKPHRKIASERLMEELMREIDELIR